MAGRGIIRCYLTLEIAFGETRYDLARKRTDSPFAFLERISAI